jgi:RecB family exonuclease
MRDGFKFFGPVADKPGFAMALADTIRDLRASGVELKQLAQLGDRGVDLSALLGEYANQLRTGMLADITDILEIAAEGVHAGVTSFTDHPILLLDVPSTSLAERTFLGALAARSPAMFVTVLAGDERSIAAFRELSDKYSCGDVKAETSLDRLKHHLFDRIPESSYHEDGQVQFFSAPGEGRECVEIARRIRAAGRAGIPFDQIAIALRSPQTYAPMLEEALERAGIEAYFARGVRRPDPSGRSLVALLLCAEEGLSAKRFAEYLSLAQVPVLRESGEPPIDRNQWKSPNDDLLSNPSATEESAIPPALPEAADEDSATISGSLRTPWKWEELLIEAAVLGGLDRWERRLKGLDNEIARKIEEMKLDEPDSPKISGLERQRSNLGHLQRFALPILKVLDQYPERALWGEWLSHLQRFATMVLRRPDHVLSVLAELQPIANVGPVTLREVREALSDRLTQLSIEPAGSRYGRVFIGTCEQFRGREFKIVFVPGLAERIFPQKLREDPLLLDGDRQTITGEGPLLMTLADRAAEERLRLRIAAGAVEETAFFSYPRVEVALARPRVPSFYALDIRRTTLGHLPNVERFELEASQNSGAELAWLAPANASEAIDDIEFDLSVLRPLLNADPKQVSGGARFLLELSPELGRSLRSRWARWRQTWSSADGICSATDETKAQLAQYRLTARAYSPTSLQTFASCPYRFLLSAIHRLAPREESAPLERLDPLTRGQLYHAVLAQFLRIALTKQMLPISKANLAKAHAVIEKLLADTAADYHEQYAPAIERVWRDEVESVRADLRGWLTQLSEAPDGYIPHLIEFAFGIPGDADNDPASTTQAAVLPEDFLLRGIIDLIEKNATGEVRLTDHKTGKNRTEEGMVVGHGETLQPVLYSMAVEALNKALVKQARLSFCTAAGGYTERTVAIDNVSRESALGVLRAIDRSVANGFLPAAPREGACTWCDFTQVCGPHEETRVQRKAQKPLEHLVKLREMP